MPSDTAAPVPAEPAPDQQVLAYINGLREDALLRSRHLARRSDTGSEGLYQPCRMSAPDPKLLTRPPVLAMVEGAPCVGAQPGMARPRRVLGLGGDGVRQRRAGPAASRTATGRASRPA